MADTVIQAAEQTASRVWEYIGKGGTTLIVAGALTAGVWFIHSRVAAYDVALAKADADNKALTYQLKAYHDEQEKDKVLISTAQTKTVVIEKRIAANDTQTAKTVEEVTKPDQTVQQVQDDATKYLPETPTITPDFKLAFTPPTVQQFIANKVELAGAKQDVEMDKSLLSVDSEIIALTDQELTDANKTIQQSQTTINDYKKAAKKSWAQRLKGYAIDAGIAFGAYEVGKAASAR